MSDYNLNVLLEKTNQSSLGIRSRQTGITLKEYFLNQKERAKNIKKSQKIKISEALERASLIINKNPDKKCSSSSTILISNKVGKEERKVIAVSGQTIKKVYFSFKNVISVIYSILKYRANQIIKLSDEGIKKSSLIIKGKTISVEVQSAKNLKEEVSQYVKLLNSSLEDMRKAFKAFNSSIK